MKVDVQAVLKWITIGEQLWERGQSAWEPVKAALEQQGINTDDASLDTVIADAERRKALAERDASGDGSTGD